MWILTTDGHLVNSDNIAVIVNEGSRLMAWMSDAVSTRDDVSNPVIASGLTVEESKGLMRCLMIAKNLERPTFDVVAEIQSVRATFANAKMREVTA